MSGNPSVIDTLNKGFAEFTENFKVYRETPEFKKMQIDLENLRVQANNAFQSLLQQAQKISPEDREALLQNLKAFGESSKSRLL